MKKDEIHQYFAKLQAEKKIKPGDKLPNYAELCRMFHTTYATVQDAFKRMERSGMIQIVHGVGSFLSGGEPLEVELFLTETTFDFAEMQKILDAVSRKNDLNLRITIRRSGRDSVDSFFTGHKVIIAETDLNTWTAGSMMDYSVFPDYESVMKKCRRFPARRNSHLLPFYYITYQGGVNLPILSRIGLSPESLDFSDLATLRLLERKCTSEHLVPFSMGDDFSTPNLWDFPPLIFVILAMMRRQKEQVPLYKPPFFCTDTIKELFRILKKPIHYRCGYPLNMAANPNIGSWISVQHWKKFGIRGEDFRIVPLLVNGRKQLFYTPTVLQTFVNPSITLNERERIWKFLKALLSSEVQRKITALGGVLSARDDFSPEDHLWCSRPDFRHFFPDDNTRMLLCSISEDKRIGGALSVLFRQYILYNADLDAVCRGMDDALLSRENIL